MVFDTMKNYVLFCYINNTQSLNQLIRAVLHMNSVYLCSNLPSFLILHISKEAWAPDLHNPECNACV